jgi:hypothetical protein
MAVKRSDFVSLINDTLYIYIYIYIYGQPEYSLVSLVPAMRHTRGDEVDKRIEISVTKFEIYVSGDNITVNITSMDSY